MTKREVIEHIRKARAAHIKWTSFAKAIHMGIPVGKDALPIIETECAFGKWFYGEAQIFSELESYQSIEEIHRLLHGLYMKIYSVRNKPIKTGLFTSESKEKKQKAKEIEELMNELNNTSSVLMSHLKILETDIKTMSENIILELD